MAGTPNRSWFFLIPLGRGPAPPTLKYYIENLAVYLQDYDEGATPNGMSIFPASDAETAVADECI